MSKRILICTNHFFPETFRCNDVAFELARKGYEVTVLTAIPDYPAGRFYEGYGFFHRRRETVRGVRVIRAFIIPRGKGGAFRLLLNYLSYFISSLLVSLRLGLFGHFDRVLIHETSPVMIGVPAVVVKKLQHIPLYFWVLDLWPESLQAAGGINNPRVLGFFRRMTVWIYRHSDKILMSSRGFEKSILEKGDFATRLVYFPNWADRALEKQAASQLPALPQGFIAMFAGNMGEAQDFEHIMQAALLLRDHPRIHFVLVGDGRKRPWVENYIAQHGLQATIHWMGRHPVEMMPAFFEQADVMLMTLKDVNIFNLTAPAKLQAYMSAAKPIVAMMKGEGPRLVAEAQCGRSVAAGDAEGLARVLREMSALNPAQLAEMGQRGKIYQQTHFDLDKSITHLEELLS